MKRLSLLTLLLCLAPAVARASGVQWGHTDLTGSSITSVVCSPNSGSGSVTSGHIEVVALASNGSGPFGISSTRVTTWNSIFTSSGAVGAQMWWGTITSSGVETITITGSSQKMGTACGEYTETNIDTSNTASNNNVSVTTTKPNVTLVAISQASNGAVTLTNFTTRVTEGGGGMVLGDQAQAATGTYTSNSSGGTGIRSIIADFYVPGVTVVPRHR
jgi:hypothetical protein